MARGVFLKKGNEKYYPAPYMPIGSIYLTVSNDNPSKWFGGTWEKMSGGYLYACVNSIGNSSYTGSSTQPHTLTINEMPSHNHRHRQWLMNGPSSGGNHYGFDYRAGYGTAIDTDSYSDSGEVRYGNFPTGGGQAHSHNIAYIGIWCWKRIA